MLQMLSGPTLHRSSLDVPLSAGEVCPVDTHVRLAGGQNYEPYITPAYLEKIGSFLQSQDSDIYLEFAHAVVQVIFPRFYLLYSLPFFHLFYSLILVLSEQFSW